MEKKLRRNEKICECAHSNFLHEMGTVTRCLAYVNKESRNEKLCECQEFTDRLSQEKPTNNTQP